MKKWIFLSFLITQTAFANGDIDITIDWVANVAKSAVLEVCGKAVEKSGKWPLVISIVHGQSTFSTVTNKEGKFCQLLSRQTFKGEVDVRAATMDGQVASTTIQIEKLRKE